MKKLLLCTLLLSLVGFIQAQSIDEDFNSGMPSGWTTIDGGENDGTWYYEDGGFGLNGTNALSIDTYPGPAGDHLITPQYTVQAGDVVSFYANCSHTDYRDNLYVLVSHTGTEAADFTDTIAHIEELPNDYQQFKYDLTAQEFIAGGDQIYVALYTNSEGEYINLDNFVMGPPTELIYEEFSDSIPEGWTVIDEGSNINTWTDTSELGYNDSPCLWVDCFESGLPNDGACDDWLITPKFSVRQGDYLSFWGFGGYYSDATGALYDTIFVKISKTGVEKADFTIKADTVAMTENDGFQKMSWLLTDIENVAAGDQIHVALHARSNGSKIYLDNFRVGQYVPPQFTDIHATSDTSVAVVYDVPVTDKDLNLPNIKLQGSDGTLTFESYQIDPANDKVVHYTGASAAMSPDNEVDTLINSALEDSIAFYSGILPLSYASLTNPDGTLISDGPTATFKGIVTFINGIGDRVWLNDAAGAHHGINTYQSSGVLADSVNVGDEVLVYGSMSPFANQTEIYPADYLATLSTGNDLFDPTVVTGADIDSSLQADTDPAEKYEGTLLQVDSAEVLEYVSVEPSQGDTLHYFVCDDGEGKFLVGDYYRLDIYTGEMSESTMEVGKKYRITGILINRGGDYMLAPRYEADMSEQQEPVGMEEEVGQPALEVYPNPVVNHLRIEAKQRFDRIVIYNAIGQRVEQIAPEARKHLTLDTGGMKEGVYFITFEKDGEVQQTRRIIKRSQ